MTGSGLLASGVATGGYGLVIEPGFRLHTARWSVKHPGWPASMPPLRIAVLTDLHAMHPWMPVPRIEHIVQAANDLQPDLTVLLGDYVAGMRRYRTGTVSIPDWTGALRALRAPYGVHAVLGNHDWWVDPRGVRSGLEAGRHPRSGERRGQAGRGRAALLARGAWRSAGKTAPMAGFQGVDDLTGTLAQTIGDNDPVVLLAHEPDIFVRCRRA